MEGAGIIFFALAFAVLSFEFRIAKFFAFSIPDYDYDDRERFIERIKKEAGDGFEPVYFYNHCGLAFNREQNKLYIQSQMESNNITAHINYQNIVSGIYEPKDLRSLEVVSHTSEYVEIEGDRFLNNTNREREARFNSIYKSGIFVPTRDGKRYHLVFFNS